jgi:hypothetical protein
MCPCPLPALPGVWKTRLVMKHRCWVGLIVLLLVAVAAACGQTQASTTNTTGVPTTTAPPLPGGYGLLPSDPHLSDRIVLSTNRITSGHIIYGSLVVMNHGTAPINLTKRCMPHFGVALSSSHYIPQMGFPADCRSTPFIINPGSNRFPIGGSTTYDSCGEASAEPPCIDRGPPPLPAGAYDAVLIGDGYLALPQPHPVPVTLAIGPH